MLMVGGQISWKECDDNGNADDPNRYTPVIRTGTIKEIHDAQKVYPRAPIYRKNHHTEKKTTKYEKGTRVFQVLVEGMKQGRKVTYANVHESQVISS